VYLHQIQDKNVKTTTLFPCKYYKIVIQIFDSEPIYTVKDVYNL